MFKKCDVYERIKNDKNNLLKALNWESNTFNYSNTFNNEVYFEIIKIIQSNIEKECRKKFIFFFVINK